MLTIDTLIQNEYFHFLLIFLFSLVIAKASHYILKTYLKKITEKTKSDIDDIIINIITKPLYILIITIGLYLALKTLSIIADYILVIEKIFFVVILVIISWIVSRILKVLIVRWFKVQKKFEKTPQLISKIISIIVYLIAFLMILKHFNIEITPLIATLGVGGLAVGLALQNTLSNFFAGLHIISDRPINVGDFIELTEGNISGYVEDVGWR